MSWFDAIILGLLQGLTEFLPVSSSGHLEIGKALLGVHAGNNLAFTVVVHGATVLSTIIVFRKEIVELIKGLFRFEWNESTQYIFKIAFSMLPIAIVGLFFKDKVEAIFETNKILLLVGFMLLVTASLLAFTFYAKQKEKTYPSKMRSSLDWLKLLQYFPEFQDREQLLQPASFWEIKKLKWQNSHF